jgi:hypothetical protein
VRIHSKIAAALGTVGMKGDAEQRRAHWYRGKPLMDRSRQSTTTCAAGGVVVSDPLCFVIERAMRVLLVRLRDRIDSIIPH